MKYYVDAGSPRGGNGTKDRPFKRINDAAQIALPGDEVIVLPGVYREYVDPKNAGTEDAPITYRSETPLGAVITGSEPIKNWEHLEGNVWLAKIPNGLFGGYNPYTTVIWGDWYHALAPYHTGEVYLNGRSMYEVFSLDEVKSPKIFEKSWEPYEYTLLQWYTEQDGDYTVIYANFGGADPNKENVEINVRRNCFYPSKEGVSYITLSGFVVKQAATNWAPPTAYQEGMVGPHWSKGWIIEDCEISDSKCCGISLGKYLQPENENKWTIKAVKQGTQTERDAICQAQRDGWTKERIGSHIIRRCNIHNCEQTGIVGHLGCVFSIIEDNHIHHINNKQQLAGAEIGGIKLHAAIDVIIRRNRIHNCSRGIWLDWQAQGTRVTQNLLYGNVTNRPITVRMGHGEDIFVEVSHGPTLIDNNLLLSTYSARLATQGLAFVHNLIAGSFTSVSEGTASRENGQPRYTPYHVPHRTEINGFMSILHGDNRFYNNVFLQNEIPENIKNAPLPENGNRQNLEVGLKVFDEYPTYKEWAEVFFDDDGNVKKGTITANATWYFRKMPIYTGGNVYVNGAKPWNKENNPTVIDADVKLKVVEDGEDIRLETNLYDYISDVSCDTISTETLGMAFEPEEFYENPDGTPIVFNTDYFDNHRPVTPMPGPFNCGKCAKGNLFSFLMRK